MDDLGVPLFLETPICFIVKHHTLCHFFCFFFVLILSFRRDSFLRNHVAKMSSPTPRPFGGCAVVFGASKMLLSSFPSAICRVRRRGHGMRVQGEELTCHDLQTSPPILGGQKFQKNPDQL